MSGPAIADSGTLRNLAAQGVEIITESPNVKVVRTNWRQRVKKVVADYNQERARWSRISRSDIARATRRAYDGYAVGQFRERDKLLPILLRHSQHERQQLADSFSVLQVHPTMASDTVPLSQVTTGINVQWEDPIIWRRDRRRTVTVQANPPDGVPASVLLGDVKERVENIDLPPGYTLEWGGDYQAVTDAALSRLRPVMLAAATTVLGVAPLLQDVFWVAMAVTIMFGLALGSIFTMVLLPVLYACFFPRTTRD